MEKLNLEILKTLGSFTHHLRKEVAKIPAVGVDITEIIDFLEKKIFENGYLPAFPATVSVNDIAAHYTVFDEGYILKKGDLIKIDFGVSFKGFITDNAFTVEIEDNKHKKIMNANLSGLNSAMNLVDIGVSMFEIGKVVEREAKRIGVNTIHNLSGHQIAINDLHCGLSVPNFNNGDLKKITSNMELAIEPFFTYGIPRVKNIGGGNILQLKNYRPVRDVIAKKVLLYIKENYPFLPFSKRWLVKDIVLKLRSERVANKAFDKRKVLYALNILKSMGIIYEYDALATEDGSIVTQYEDSVVFTENQKVIITRE